MRSSAESSGPRASTGRADAHIHDLAMFSYNTDQLSRSGIEATRRSVKTLAEQGLVERVGDGYRTGARLPLNEAEQAAAARREDEQRQLEEQIADLERQLDPLRERRDTMHELRRLDG